MIIYRQKNFLDPVQLMILLAADRCNPSNETLVASNDSDSICFQALTMTAMNNQWIVKIRETLGDMIKQVYLHERHIRVEY